MATAFDHPEDYTLTKREYISFALCKMLFPPGGPVPPGVDNYSNTGYLLLGMVVESVTGLPYEDAVKTLLLAPLGIPTARRSKSLVEGRAANEVFYQRGIHGVAQPGNGR